MNNSTSYVTRSELWVWHSCKEALELLMLLRKEKVDTWVAFIKEDRLRPQFRNFWNLFGKTKDTNDLNILREYSDNKYLWDWWGVETSFSREEKQLMEILAATDPELQSGNVMQLSVEDSALIEKWLNRIESRKENPGEYQNL
jgi:hypothetical protein